MTVAEPKATSKAIRIVVAVVAFLFASGGAAFMFLMRAHHPSPAAVTEHLRAAHGMPDAYAIGSTASAFVPLAQSGHDPLGKARAILDGVLAAMNASGAVLVSDPADVPPSRSLDAITTALRERGGRVTTLDLARLMAGVLQAAHVDARVAEQTLSIRAEEPADPTAVLGRFAVQVGEHAADVRAGTLVAARDLGIRPLDDRALLGAMLAQSALNELDTGRHDPALVEMADDAVRSWPDSPVPLEVRASVWRAVGGSSGTELALQDTAAAVSLRDNAADHLFRTHVALGAGEAVAARGDVQRAVRLAPTWGDAALAAALMGVSVTPDAGDRCSPLERAREDWASDALVLCHAVTAPSPPPPELHTVAQRFLDDSTDPPHLALAAAAGAEGATSRVAALDRRELASWLLLLGRTELAGRVLGWVDAGH